MRIQWEIYEGDGAYAVVNYGVKDSRGREVGGLLSIDIESDGTVRGCIQGARNGKKFGAINTSRPTYSSFEEAKADLEKKAATAKRRTEKAAAKTGGVYLTASELYQYKQGNLKSDHGSRREY